MNRVYHQYTEWEEIYSNMWGDSDNPKEDLKKAINFTGDYLLYGSFMKKVVREWPVSCENALTDQHLNKKAWIGHAAVAIALQIPEDIVRKAWGYLTDEQQLLANKAADEAIQIWQVSYQQDK